jgi:hypothetical protein
MIANQRQIAVTHQDELLAIPYCESWYALLIGRAPSLRFIGYNKLL